MKERKVLPRILKPIAKNDVSLCFCSGCGHIRDDYDIIGIGLNARVKQLTLPCPSFCPVEKEMREVIRSSYSLQKKTRKEFLNKSIL